MKSGRQDITDVSETLEPGSSWQLLRDLLRNTSAPDLDVHQLIPGVGSLMLRRKRGGSFFVDFFEERGELIGQVWSS
jgi:hypothetical protein